MLARLLIVKDGAEAAARYNWPGGIISSVQCFPQMSSLVTIESKRDCLVKDTCDVMLYTVKVSHSIQTVSVCSCLSAVFQPL